MEKHKISYLMAKKIEAAIEVLTKRGNTSSIFASLELSFTLQHPSTSRRCIQYLGLCSSQDKFDEALKTLKLNFISNEDPKKIILSVLILLEKEFLTTMTYGCDFELGFFFFFFFFFFLLKLHI